jgi:hypothetical protein
MGIYSSMAPGVPRCSKHTLNIMHWRIPCFYHILPCYQSATLSQTWFWSQKIRPICPQKQDFAEDTVGSKFGAPELKPRKSLLHGTNFYCLGLSTAKPKIAPFLDFLALKASGQYCCYAPGAVAAAQLHEESERQSCQTLFYNVLVHVLQTTTLPVGTRIILSHRMRIILKHRRIRIISKHKRPG